MEKLIEEIKMCTDLFPWYWYSYGEKCYAFAIVEAFPEKDGDKYPDPGSELTMNDNGDWVGENGVKMIIESVITSIEHQNGDTICHFIAAAHAKLLGKDFITKKAKING
jgi:hypothetical protein